MKKWKNQLCALLRKNFLLMKRQRKAVFREIFIPILYLGVLVMLKSVMTDQNFAEETVFEVQPLDLGNCSAWYKAGVPPVPRIALAPCTDKNVMKIRDDLQKHNPIFCANWKKMELTFVCHSSIDNMIDEAVQNQTLFAGISFTDLDESFKPTFTIHINSSIANYPLGQNYRSDAPDSGLPKDVFLSSGFLTIQHAVQQSVLRVSSSVHNLTNMKIAMTKFPHYAYEIDPSVETLTYMLPIYLALIFSFQVRTGLGSVLEEKEKGLREHMIVQGLPSVINTLGWLVTISIKQLALVIIASLLCVQIILPSSSWIVLFLFFFVFSTSCTAYVFVMSSVFTNPKVGVGVGYLLFMACAVPGIFLRDHSIPASLQIFLSLLSPTGFTLAVGIFNECEGVGMSGIQLSNLNESCGQISAPIGSILLMLILDIFLYFFLAWYLDQIMPKKIGTRKSCCFCLDKFWKKNKEKVHSKNVYTSINSANDILSLNSWSSSGHANAIMEPVARDEKKKGIRICNLSKTFKSPSGGNIKAVNGFSLDMYIGEITALLGHNGAGKTTTINMLTGMTSPSGGDAFMNGHSITDDMDMIRSMIGVCPQHNILWDLLTVEEHLQLFARLKCIDNPQAAVNKAIKDVDLVEKKNVYSKALSGGMKRKLSVAMALLGNPRVVFLDEPTAGMDPAIRRAVWDILSHQKHERVIILTTHHMEEADLLGDRIAVMSRGKLQACGSSLFLKSQFGIGYHLILECQAGAYNKDVVERSMPEVKENSNAVIIELVKKHLPSAEFIPSVVGNQNTTEMHFVLPLTSSHAFPALFEKLDILKDDTNSLLSGYGLTQTTLEEVFLRLAEQAEQEELEEKEEKGILQVSNVERKRLASLGKSRLMKPTIPESKDKIMDDIDTVMNVDISKRSTSRQVKTLVGRRISIAKRDKKTTILQILSPVLMCVISTAFRSLQDIGQQNVITTDLTKELLDDSHIQCLPTKFPYSTPTDFDFGHALANHTPLPVTGNKIGGNILVNKPFFSGRDMSQEEFARYLLDECKGYCGFGMHISSSQAMLFYNSSFYASPALLLNWFGTATLREALGNTMQFQTSIEPFPEAVGQTDNLAGGVAYSIATVTYIIFGLLNIGALSIYFVVNERKMGTKHQLFIAGTKRISYWLSMIIFDMLFFLLPFTALIILIAVLGLPGLSSPAINLFAVAMMLLPFAGAILTFSYLFSFLFKDPKSAQAYFTMALIAFYIIFFGIVIALEFLNPSSVNFFSIIQNLLLPGWALFSGMQKLALKGVECAQQSECSYNPFSWDVCGKNIVYMLAQVTIFFGLVNVMESYTKDQVHESIPPPPPDEDIDVKAERQRILSNNTDNDNILMKNLRKIYRVKGQPDKVAVDNFVLGIPNGICFGLLGPNGAGKTSLMSMLTGAIAPNAGNAWISGHSVRSDLPKVHELLGFCPQFNTLMDKMTGREHLEMYAKIKGIPDDQVNSITETLMRLLKLTEHADKLSQEYSGGNKRKLSLAIALLGGTSIIMLDEPSSGMDPMARHSMSKVISRSLRGRSVILTTHLMEECEVMANRVGIMINGKLACLGSIQRIKSRFGGFWQMEIQTESHIQSQQVQDFVLNISPTATLIEWHNGHYMYKIPNKNLSLSRVFKEIEVARKSLRIIHYSISQATLEQIFLSFARKQHENE